MSQSEKVCPDCDGAPGECMCHCPTWATQEINELEDKLFRMKQIGDRLFLHANKLAIPLRTPELDEAIMAWAGVHKGEY